MRKATKPVNLKKSLDPVGQKNDQYLTEYAKKSQIVVISWGNHGDFLNREQEVIKILSEIQAPIV